MIPPTFAIHARERKGGIFMLGTSRWKTKHVTIEDFNTPQDFIKYMFDGIRGWICRGQMKPEYRQSMYRYNGIMQSDLDGENVYVSMNTFYVNERLVDRLKRLNALYVDIDCYNMGLDKNSVLMDLQDNVFDTVIPCPTFVIDSGRGLYLIWKLKNEDRNALPRWTTVQDYLFKTLEPYGADPACKDSARILRVPFSINGKSNTQVEILQFNDVTYRISDIEREYGVFGTSHRSHSEERKEKTHPYNTATEAMRRYAHDIALKLGIPLPDFENYAATKEWLAKMRITPSKSHYEGCATPLVNSQKSQKLSYCLTGYCEDIEKLMIMRQGGDCKREIALFLYRLFTYDLSGDKDLALERTLALNARLSCPFPERYVIQATKSAERKIDKGETYRYKRESIIQILEIKENEMDKLSYLVGAIQRKERKKKNNRKTYLDRLASAGKETKAQSIKTRRDAISAMLEEGKSAKEIQVALQISKATYYREYAIIKVEGIKTAVKGIVRELEEKITETTETAARSVLESLESQPEVADVTTKNDKVEESSEKEGEPVVHKNNVSKIQPYNYKSMAKPCRTAFGIHRGVPATVPDIGGGSG